MKATRMTISNNVDVSAVPAGAPWLVSVSKDNKVKINGINAKGEAREATMSIEKFIAQVAARGTEARFGLKYEPKLGMGEQNQSIHRILRRETEYRGGDRAPITGGAEPGFFISMDSGETLFLRMADLPSLIAGKYVWALPNAPVLDRIIRTRQASVLGSGVNLRIGVNFVSGITHEVELNGKTYINPGRKEMKWWARGQDLLDKTAFGDDAKETIAAGEVRTGTDGIDYTWKLVTISPMDVPAYTAGFILGVAGFFTTEAVEARNGNTGTDINGFVSAPSAFQAVFGDLPLELPKATRNGRQVVWNNRARTATPVVADEVEYEVEAAY